MLTRMFARIAVVLALSAALGTAVAVSPVAAATPPAAAAPACGCAPGPFRGPEINQPVCTGALDGHTVVVIINGQRYRYTCTLVFGTGWRWVGRPA